MDGWTDGRNVKVKVDFIERKKEGAGGEIYRFPAFDGLDGEMLGLAGHSIRFRASIKS